MGSRLRLSAFALVQALASGGAPAQTNSLQRVEVVGSRLPRVDAESALPVQVIRRDEIERSGATTVEEVLDRVSANFGGFHEALGLGNADTPGLSGASLRGLGTGETLVLLNGRRLANYAFTSTSGPGVDLHAIPLAAIERIEVLKDGASALYGSDAIAGVINFVTRQDFAGAEIGLGHSATEAGGGNRSRLTTALGAGDLERDGFNLFVVADAQKSQGLRAVDRPFAATTYRPQLGLDGTSPASFPANTRGTLLNPAAPACTPDTVSKGNACWFDYAKTLELVAPSHRLNLLGRATLRVAPEIETYAELLGSSGRTRFISSPSPAIPNAGLAGARFVLPAASPYYPTGLGLSGDLPLAYRTVPLGGRTTDVDADNLRLLLGARWPVAGWDFDSGLSFNENRARERYVSGLVGAGLLRDALATGLVNPFGDSGPAGDALLDATQLHGTSRKAVGRTLGIDLRASRDLMRLDGGALALATGVEARHESLRDTQYALAADVVGGSPSPPKQGSRDAGAAYLELIAPLVKGFELQAAARLDRYSDYGSSISPKLSVRLQPVAWWLLRASIGRGFRAPSLPELYTQRTTADAATDVADPARCPTTGLPSDCLIEVLIGSGGNPDLRPQRSVQANAGLVVEPMAGWRLSVDAWWIRVRHIIGSLNADDVLADIPRFDGRNVVRGPIDPAYPGLPGPIASVDTFNENLGESRISGIDLSLATRPWPTPLGRVSARLDGTYVRRARQEVFEGDELDLIGRIAPRWQHVASLNLERDAWSATLSHRYRHGYPDAHPLPDHSTRRVEAYRVWDGQFVVAASRDVRLILGVRNLLDTDPPFSNQSSSFQAGYDPLYADPRGRTWTIGLRAGWR